MLSKFFAKKYNFCVFLILLISGFWAIFLASKQQVWFDESYSIWITKGKSLSQTIELTSVDAHPPLYYLLLNFWGGIFNWEFMWLRVLSVIFFLGSIFVAIKFIEKVSSRKVALLSGLLLAFSPFLLRYAFEIRMYSLASLIAVGSSYIFYEIISGNRSRKLWVAYGFLVSLGMWTLYTLVVVFLSHFLIAIYLQFRKKSIKIWLEPWFKSYILSVVLWLPWLTSVIYQMKNSASSGIGEYIGFSQIENMINFLAFYLPNGRIASIFSILVFSAVIYIFSKTLKSGKISMMSWIAILPFLITIFLSQPIFLRKPFFVERYMAQFSILFYAVIAVFVAKRFLSCVKFSKISLAVLVLIIIFGNFNLAQFGNFNFQNYRLSNAKENMDRLSGICKNHNIIMDDVYLFMELEIYNSGRCGMNIFTKNNSDFGGGYAPVNRFERRMIGDDIMKNGDGFAVVNKDKLPDFLGGYFEFSEVEEFSSVNLSLYRFSKK